MKFFKQYLFIVLGSFHVLTALSQSPEQQQFIRVNKNGSVKYIPDAQGNIIPDFSKVGCYQNSKALPDVPVKKIIEAAEGNSQQLIQSAIDELAALPVDADGFRGAILLKKGIYKIPGTIKINASGIILRGEGETTRIIATGKSQRTLISINGSGELIEIRGTRQKIKEKYVPLGSISFTVTKAKKYKAGDRIVVFRPGTQKWISDLKMDQIDKRDSNTRQWIPAEYDLHFERTITKISRNKIFIDNPIVMSMEEQYGGGEIYKCKFEGRINNIGIENLLCESEYSTNTDEDHGWDAIKINRAENCWVKNVTAIYFGYSCVNLGTESRNITVLDCKSLDAKSKIEGGRRYSFNNDGQMNLFMNCFATEGRHDYVTGAKVRGPNVFYNCKAEKTHADIGPHHRWAMGTLYDNITSDGEINAQDRGNWGTGHGWSGVNQVFWNCTASKAAIQDPWGSGKNYVIGMTGIKYNGRLKGRPETAWFSVGKETPVSLYRLQLKQQQKSNRN